MFLSGNAASLDTNLNDGDSTFAHGGLAVPQHRQSTQLGPSPEDTSNTCLVFWGQRRNYWGGLGYKATKYKSVVPAHLTCYINVAATTTQL
jgi:hypothetical protein